MRISPYISSKLLIFTNDYEILTEDRKQKQNKFDLANKIIDWISEYFNKQPTIHLTRNFSVLPIFSLFLSLSTNQHIYDVVKITVKPRLLKEKKERILGLHNSNKMEASEGEEARKKIDL